jgi:hypothetical protein
MKSLYEKSWEWARRASKQVMKDAAEPTLEKAQTLQILSLYDFAVGQISRARIHSGTQRSSSHPAGKDFSYLSAGR